MTYKVVKRFGMFEYNSKTRGCKIVWKNPGDTVNETVYKRMNDPEKYVSRD